MIQVVLPSFLSLSFLSHFSKRSKENCNISLGLDKVTDSRCLSWLFLDSSILKYEIYSALYSNLIFYEI